MTKHLSPHLQDHTFRQRLVQCQIKLQESFCFPHKAIILLLLLFPYLQMLKYPIDIYIGFWQGQSTDSNLTWLNNSPSQQTALKIFSYLNLANYTDEMTTLVSISIGCIYIVLYLIILGCYKYKKVKPLLIFYKILKSAFTSLFFIFMITQFCKSIKQIKQPQQGEQAWIKIVGCVVLVLFFAILAFQNVLDFDFIVVKDKSKVLKHSNWVSTFTFLYILANQITISLILPTDASPITKETITPHLIVMNIFFALLVLILVLKKQYEDESDYVCKCQRIFILCNLLAILMIDAMILFPFWMDISLWIGFSLVLSMAVWYYEGFSIEFQLQNVNKWNTSQIMIKYSKKLIILVQKKDDPYYKTLLLGYAQIHNQKCDNQLCPLKFDNSSLEVQIQEIIKIIFNEGCKLSPISQELLLQYSLFLYYFDNNQKALKVLLSIEIEELSLEKLYKYVKLKQKVYGEISEHPDKKFLDLLSEMHVKQYEKDILKKFQESALANLEFWSVLNEDYPDFNKLYEVGKSRVSISEQVHQLYYKICKIAHSQRITHLYINYLKDIENDEFLYDQIFEEINKEKKLNEKIVIEDWLNDSRAILILSQEEQHKGIIIDLNTTCATMLGYEKYQIISRDIHHIFPDRLQEQINRFLQISTSQKVSKYQPKSSHHQSSPDIFYIEYSNGYAMRVKRSLQHYNSIETGMSFIITLQHQFNINSCSLLFTEYQIPKKIETIKKSGLLESRMLNSKRFTQTRIDEPKYKLISMTSSCIQFLGMQSKLVEIGVFFSDILQVPFETLLNDKIASTNLSSILNLEKIQSYSERIISRAILKEQFSVEIEQFRQFIAVKFSMNSVHNQILLASNTSNLNNKDENYLSPGDKEQQEFETDLNINKCSFQFQIHDCFHTFTYLGDNTGQASILPLGTLFSLSVRDKSLDKMRNVDYGVNITTLRLHENYIKVIEDSGSQIDDAEEKNSTTSTQNHLISNQKQFEKLSKKDLQRIFQSHQSYTKFLDQNQLKSNIRICSFLCFLLTISTYIGIYWVFESDFKLSIDNYNKIINKNQLIQQVATARYLVVETNLVIMLSQIDLMEEAILAFMDQVKIKIQQYLPQYTEQFNVKLYTTPDNLGLTKQFLSDQFYLTYAGYYDSIITQITGDSPLDMDDNLQEIQPYDYWYIDKNGEYVKKFLVDNSYQFFQQKKAEVINIINKNLFILIGGFVLQIILSILLLRLIYNINKQKIQVLEIFLESNEKIIQDFSAKTESFLMTLHIEQSSDNVDNLDDTENKKKAQFSNMFGKKKRFKTTEFKKTPYIIIWIMYIISCVFYGQNFLLNNDKFIFVTSSMSYAYQSSIYGDVMFSGVTNIDKQLIKIQNGENQELNTVIQQFNTDFLNYEKQFLTAHYASFGQFEEFHQYFTKIFLEDICNGEVKITDACQNPLSNDGASIMITDLTVTNQLLNQYLMNENSTTSDFRYRYFKNLEIIKNSHEKIKEKSVEFWYLFQTEYKTELLNILLIWGLILLLLTLIFQIYLSKVVVKDLKNMQEMLKFLPISFAIQSPRMNNHMSLILQNSSF